MRRTLYRSIAAISALAAVISAPAARRARYGGGVRVEIAQVMQLDPAEPKLSGLVFETLVRLDERGKPQPWLAMSWTHDQAHKRWIFTPRPNVTLHNGMTWQPSEASLSFPDDRPIERTLAELSRPRNAIAIRTPDGALVGTGPFAIAHWEPGKSASLSAHADYWGGRPYLDSIEIGMGQTLRQQALDLELGKADAIEADTANIRRLRQQNANLAVSAPVEALALVFDGSPPVAAPTAEAVALSIDRSAIQTVLLQRQGEVSSALLPQWLSGYSFVFPVARDLARARQLSTSAPGVGTPAIGIGYDRNDALCRAIAERIAVNAGEAGITVRAAADGPVNAHIVRLHIASSDPWVALEDLAEQLKLDAPQPNGNLYNAERALLGAGRVISLVHVPMAWQLSAKVHGFAGWHLEDAWVEP